MPLVFISSSVETADLARRLSEGLEAKGFAALSGSTEAVSRADAFVVVVKPESPSTPAQEREWFAVLEHASDLTKKLIPVIVGSGEPPSFLGNWQALRVPEDLNRWPKFVDTIAKALRSEQKPKITGLRKADLKRRDQRLNSIGLVARQLKSLGM